MADACGIPEDDRAEHIHIVPGNHDLKRAESFDSIETLAKNYDADEGLFKEGDLTQLESHFGFFMNLCKSVYGERLEERFNLKYHPHAYRVSNGIAWVYLNTALVHHDESMRRRLVICNDSLDLLLAELAENHPGLPVVILGHHSPDLFDIKEKKAVEQILTSKPASLYLCGDEHEHWWRDLRGCPEITMGCIKYGSGEESTFLRGDVESGTYAGYHWADNAWKPFESFNDEIARYMARIKPLGRHFPASALRDETGKATESLRTRDIKTDQNRTLNELLLPWMKGSDALQVILPDLFVEPTLTSTKQRVPCDWKGLVAAWKTDEGSDMRAFIGEAGTGKSTFFKYLYLYCNDDLDILYLKAASLFADDVDVGPYERKVRNILLGAHEVRSRFLVLLDGMDEAFSERREALRELLAIIAKQKKVTVWLGWREEPFHRQFPPNMQSCLKDVIRIEAWRDEQARRFAGNYAARVGKPEILERFDEIATSNNAVREFARIPLQLMLLVYLLDNEPDWTAGRDMTAEQATYSLFREFYEYWLDNERERSTSSLSVEQVTAKLRDIAHALYYGDTCVVDESDSAITGLLTFSHKRGSKVANSFYHHRLCSFFIADHVVEAMEQGGEALVEALRVPLRDDVTGFVKSAISSTQHHPHPELIRSNLLRAYREQMSAEGQDGIGADSNLVVKNELAYFIVRAVDDHDEITRFLEYGWDNETSPFMKLTIGYGAIINAVPRIALEYARSLVPGSEAAIVHQSWSLAYRGDVAADPYRYHDNGIRPWDTTRSHWMRQLQSSERTPMRLRLAIFPMLRCFYESRNWADVDRDDYDVIAAAEINPGAFSESELDFVESAKASLVAEIERRLH